MFALLLVIGLTFLALTVFCGLKYNKLKKSMAPVVPEDRGNDFDDDRVQNGGRDSLNGEVGVSSALLSGDKKKEPNSSSERSFSESKPAVEQEDRVFNLHG